MDVLAAPYRQPERRGQADWTRGEVLAVTTPRKTVDARGLSCPMPVLRTQRAIREVEPGELIEVIATDPGSLRDIPAWVKATGHELEAVDEAGPEFRFLIRRAQ